MKISPISQNRGVAAAKKAGFAIWAVATTVLITYLMALHAVPLPAFRASAWAKGDLPTPNAKMWRGIHVLAADCPCSASVADYLGDRGPAVGIEEVVYISGEEKSRGAGDEVAAKLTARGFSVNRVTPAELLSTLGVRGGPWLLWIDPRGNITYSGGYASQRPRPGVSFQDLSILRRLRAGTQVVPNPAFGCAIDPSLQREMDPLALR